VSATSPTTTTAPSTARRARTEEIIDAATRLFSERGFTETGIDDIGAAIGVNGPAVYRYFASKEDLLVAVLDRAVQHAAGVADAARSGASSPEDALQRVVEGAVAVCIADRALAALYWNEARHVPTPQRSRVERAQRQMIDDFADILRGVRPELTPSEARMAVFAASTMMLSVAVRATSVDDATLHEMLSRMAHAALLAAPASNA
jgi:AcrR family transcriptional regulator